MRHHAREKHPLAELVPALGLLAENLTRASATEHRTLESVEPLAVTHTVPLSLRPRADVCDDLASVLAELVFDLAEKLVFKLL